MMMFKQTILPVYHRLYNHWQSIKQWFELQMDEGGKLGTIKSLEGVRGIACLTVMWFHLNEIARSNWNPLQSNVVFSAIALGGSAGVTLFFVLSGFLLFMPFVKYIVYESRRPSTRSFYLRRALRIVPGYYFSLALLILLAHPEYLRPDHLSRLGLFLVLYMDARSTFMQINGPYWTLAIEWQFYLLLPWLALGIGLIARLSGGSTRRKVCLVIAQLLAVIVWGVFSRFWGAYYLQHSTQSIVVPRSVLNVFLFFTYGDAGKYLEDFAVGMLLSLCYVLVMQRRLAISREGTQTKLAAGNSTQVREAKVLHCVTWLFPVGIGLLLFMAVWHYNTWYSHVVPALDGRAFWYKLASEWMLASGFGLCLAAILFGSLRLRRVFEWLPLRFAGAISYSLYIWHLPLLFIFMNTAGDRMGHWNIFAVYSLYTLWIVCVIIPFAYLCYRFIERPWMKLGTRWAKKVV